MRTVCPALNLIDLPTGEVVSGLIERVSVSWEEGQAVVAQGGALTALLGLATNAKGPALAGPYGSSVKVATAARNRRSLCVLGTDM
jgi:hypothetical protein